MNQRIKVRIIFSLCILSFLLITIAINSVTASSGRTTYHGAVGGTAVIAQKDVVRGGNDWSGSIYSHTQDHSSIGNIGWYWWTIQEVCSGAIVSQHQYNGYAITSSAVYDVAVDSISYCANPSNRYGKTLGKHDFKHGSDDWDPHWVHSEKLS